MKVQSETYSGPITFSGCEKFEHIKNQLEKYKINIKPMPYAG